VNFRTEGCSAYDHPEITVVFQDVPVDEAVPGWILRHFQDLVASGSRLQVGDTVRMGMRTLRVIPRDDLTFGLEERVDEDEWVERVDRTMTDLWYQAAAASKLGLPEDLSSVSDRDYVVLQPCVRDSQILLMNRVEPETPDGYAWMIGCGQEHEHADWMISDLFQLALAMPYLTQFLALPVDTGVAVHSDSVSAGGGVLADVVRGEFMLTPDGGMHFGPEPVVSAATAHAAAVKVGDGLYRTSIGARYDHPEIVIRVGEPLIEGLRDPLAQWLLDYLQDSLSGGTRFLPGQTVQVGWRMVRIVERGDELGVQERADGDQWEEQVGRTLHELWLQREVAASVGLDERLSFPVEGQSASVADCATGAPPAVLLRRSTPGGPAASGWAVSCAGDHQHGAWETRPLTELVGWLPSAVQFLALPVDSSVVIDSPETTATGRIGVRISADGRSVQPRRGSYLAALAG
jgi:hypothetical protein